MEKISVIVPAYNAEQTIKRCMDSLVNQRTDGMFDYEVVVVDDGSKDATPSILDSYSDSYNFIKIYHIPNGGASAARKYAIDHSRSDYLAFCDSDDYVDDDWLLTMYKTLKEHDADISIIGAYINDKDVNATQSANPSLFIWDKNEAIETFLEHRLLNGALWSKLFKRALFDDLEWQHAMVLAEDDFLIWQIIRKVNKIVTTGVRRYHYMFNSQSLSNTKFNYNIHQSIRTLFNRIIDDCSKNSELNCYLENAKRLEYLWTSTFIYRSVFSDYPEAPVAEKEMARILRKGGFKRLNYHNGLKSKLRTAALALNPSLTRRLFKIIK